MKMLKSFGYALKGLASAFRDQLNLWVHLLALIVVVMLGFYFDIVAWEWCVLILSVGLVFSLELINSAIEDLTDLVTREQNPMAGKVKDISAAAVLVASLGALIIGVIIFGKYLGLGH